MRNCVSDFKASSIICFACEWIRCKLILSDVSQSASPNVPPDLHLRPSIPFYYVRSKFLHKKIPTFKSNTVDIE